MFKRKGTVLLLGVFLICASALFWTGCANPGGSDTSGSATTPQAMKGTVAFSDKAAVIELSIGGVKSVAKSAVQSRAIHSVGGRIRFDGQDFTITGDYDTEAGAIAATTSTVSIGGHSIRFEILGVYSPSTGFRGSVKRYVDSGWEFVVLVVQSQKWPCCGGSPSRSMYRDECCYEWPRSMSASVALSQGRSTIDPPAAFPSSPRLFVASLSPGRRSRRSR